MNKENRKMSTCNELDLEALGSWPTIYGPEISRALNWTHAQCCQNCPVPLNGPCGQTMYNDNLCGIRMTLQKGWLFLPLLIQCVWWTNFIWRSTWNSKCHVTFSNTKMNVNWHLHFLLKCHHNATCLVVHDMSICRCQLTCVVFFFPSHTSYQNLNRACQLSCS